MGEFDLIARYFTPANRAASVVLGVGDDAALLTITPGHHLVAAVDTLVNGVHFPPDTEPRAIGHKALAVNLSDLAAMGANPRWALLALTLPQVDDAWLGGFAAGFFVLANRYGVDLVGGDTTRGPLAVTVQALGEVRSGAALTRAGACPGDDVYVSGCLGDAALGLAALQDGERGDDAELLRRRLDYPEPRCTLGRRLIGLASAAIDISDGLLADLGHLLRAGGVGARIERDRIPLSAEVASRTRGEGAWRAILAGGDDYELCFTAPSSARGRVAELAQDLGEPVTRIGMIEAEPGLRLCDAAGLRLPLPGEGYDHFNG